jgi:hypothetical protein
MVIYGDEGGRASELYQRPGFIDEVHWRRSWARHSTTD